MPTPRTSGLDSMGESFSTAPLLALSIESKQLISELLNPPKILPSDDGWPRDWRGLAYIFDIPGEKIPFLASQQDPSDKILGLLQEKSNTKITFKDLQTALEKIDRWDVINDTEPLFLKDAEQYFERVERFKLSPEAIDNNVDAEMLTVDDLYRFRVGLEKQSYDAFLLYADEDFEFAKEMMERLEKEKLKLCLKDRDLIAGVTFEHKAMMQLISDRCNRLIVIISPYFLKSPANKFFLTYAHAVGIDKQQRKLIPCIYKDCELPRELSFTKKVFYSRRNLYDFWGNLCNSIRTPPPPTSKVDNLATSSCIISSMEPLKLNLESYDTKETILASEENCCKIADESPKEINDSLASLSSAYLDDVVMYSGTKKNKSKSLMKSVKKKLTAKFKA